MPSPTLLHSCRSGKALFLPEEGRIKLQWECAVLLLRPQELSDLDRFLAQAEQQYSLRQVEDPGHRCISLSPNPNATLSLLVSYEELLRLRQLIGTSLLMLQVQDALQAA